MNCYVRLPNELILKILYKYGGLEHKSALCMKQYINEDYINYKNKKCFMCNQKNISLALCDKSWITEEDLIEIKKYIIEKNQLQEIYLCFSCAH